MIKTGKYLSILGLTILPNILSAQLNKSCIKWTEGLTWSEIKGKAKSTGKYIYVDCYATWCGPCKYMDSVVFASGTICKFINENFIPVKLQMDTTKKDNEQVKLLYKAARQLNSEFRINVLPTYLFFSSKGKLVHREAGIKSIEGFLKIAGNAINVNMQYCKLINNYNRGKKKYDKMAYLAKVARSIGDTKLAKSISSDYIVNYLSRLDNKSLFTKDNVEFIAAFTESSHDYGFKFLYNHSEAFDSVMNSIDYAQSKVDVIISKEEVSPVLVKSVTISESIPNWDSVRESICRKYNSDYADRLVLKAQERYYYSKSNWKELHKVYEMQYYRYLINDERYDAIINNMAWHIFEYSNDKELINRVINWMSKILDKTSLSVSKRANMLDTYANLLYKCGYSEVAIEVENKAILIATENNWNSWKNGWTQTVHKMKKGEPTWPVKIER
jgi:thiol-disulfide isomerase/thioredoxin